MAKTLRAHRIKRQRNAANSARFKRRDKATKKLERHLRVLTREQTWLDLMGIERDGKPLAFKPKGVRLKARR